ncbi:MAG: right-handed parallel beta-helix repeat-containing protein, partial [Verrucomicrobia bacterium]|nr:right-handed parallel beta-helix repeat-containing protein [Verrucomicrobiota bacterium]
DPVVPPPLPTTAAEAGADAIIPGELELYPTYTAVSLELPYQGDANGNATAEFEWRLVGESEWQPGVAVTVDRDHRFMWASIWPLEQDQELEVRFTVSDPSPLPDPFVARVRTHRLVLETQGGQTVYVSPQHGDDDNAGTQAAPFKTLQRAVRRLQPGDTVFAMSGQYRESVYMEFSAKGTAENPIVVSAAPGQHPVLDSSLAVPRNYNKWQQVSAGVWKATVPAGDAGAGYVAEDGKRMYRYETLADLQADKFENKRCWARDGETLYVRPGDGRPPHVHAYNVAQHEYGFYLEGCRYVVLKGFEMRYYGSACVRLSGSGTTGNVIYGNDLHNSQQGMFLKTDTTDLNAIWHNTIYEPGIRDFSWNSIKASGYARQGVNILYAGRGTSVCYNDVHDWFDCIVALSWKRPNDLQLNRDMDVMYNRLWNVGDDALELDGGGVNMRVHGNRIRNAHTAISLAPVERGPVYATRNDGTYHTLFFKLSVGAPSEGWTYAYHNSGYSMATGNESTMLRFNDYSLPDKHRVFKNNAFIGSEWSVHRGRSGEHELDYNCYFNTPSTGFRKFQWDQITYTSLASFQAASGQEMHGLYADPRFTSTPDLDKFAGDEFPLHSDTSIGDLHPLPDSPLIDAGGRVRGINNKFAGAAPDIGAFEVGL